MSLWIRSQNKEILVECNAVVINPSDCSDYYIYAYRKSDRVYLGTYSSEEKALNVLNMIEMLLEDLCMIQMPLNGEVQCNDK